MKIRKHLLFLIGGLLALFGCSKVELLNLTIPKDGYTVTADIAYGGDPRQKLDIYLPDHPAAGHPVIVFYYGGSWQTGSKDDYLFVGQALASRGYTAVIADYRLYPQVYFPTFMDDVADAYVWAHNHIADYGGDPNRMYVMGHSAGAYNAMMLTVNDTYMKAAGGKPSWIKGVVGLAGPYDFLPFTDPDIIAIFSHARDIDTQPVTYVKPGLPPMLLMYGDKDTEVLPRNSIRMADKLRSSGDPATLKLFPGFDHIDIVLALAHGFRDKGPVLDDIDQFLQELGDKSGAAR